MLFINIADIGKKRKNLSVPQVAQVVVDIIKVIIYFLL